MMNPIKKCSSVDEYISMFPPDIQMRLIEIRQIVKAEIPLADEVISYGMPAFRYKGIVVYYAAHKEHIGFYPTSSGVSNFKEELAGYHTSKGAVQFPYREDLPVHLIQKIVQFRKNENIDKEILKKYKKY
jgi:uncharacterized protein YdhG (YjbR/CyaY superfamily)